MNLNFIDGALAEATNLQLFYIMRSKKNFFGQGQNIKDEEISMSFEAEEYEAQKPIHFWLLGPFWRLAQFLHLGAEKGLPGSHHSGLRLPVAQFLRPRHSDYHKEKLGNCKDFVREKVLTVEGIIIWKSSFRVWICCMELAISVKELYS